MVHSLGGRPPRFWVHRRVLGFEDRGHRRRLHLHRHRAHLAVRLHRRDWSKQAVHQGVLGARLGRVPPDTRGRRRVPLCRVLGQDKELRIHGRPGQQAQLRAEPQALGEGRRDRRCRCRRLHHALRCRRDRTLRRAARRQPRLLRRVLARGIEPEAGPAQPDDPVPILGQHALVRRAGVSPAAALRCTECIILHCVEEKKGHILPPLSDACCRCFIYTHVHVTYQGHFLHFHDFIIRSEV